MTETISGIIPKNSGNSKTYYWSIHNGQLARKVDETTPNAVSRKNKKDVLVYEVFERGLVGKLRDVVIHDGDYGEQLVVKLNSNGTYHAINIPKESKYYNSFMERLIGIDVSQDVTISPYNFADEKDPDKKIVGISVKQNGVKIDSQYRSYKDGKAEVFLGYPKPPKQWNDMNKREQTNFLFDIDEFLKKEL